MIPENHFRINSLYHIMATIGTEQVMKLRRIEKFPENIEEYPFFPFSGHIVNGTRACTQNQNGKFEICILKSI